MFCLLTHPLSSKWASSDTIKVWLKFELSACFCKNHSQNATRRSKSPSCNFWQICILYGCIDNFFFSIVCADFDFISSCWEKSLRLICLFPSIICFAIATLFSSVAVFYLISSYPDCQIQRSSSHIALSHFLMETSSNGTSFQSFSGLSWCFFHEWSKKL